MGRIKKAKISPPSPPSIPNVYANTPDPRVLSILRGMPELNITSRVEADLIGTLPRVSSWDILEQTTRHLSQLFHRYSGLIESVSDILYAFSLPDGNITLLNPAFEKITGLRREDCLHTPFLGLVHPEDVPLALAQQERMLMGDFLERAELRFRSVTGDYWSGEISCRPEIREGSLIGAYGVIRDTTQQKCAEEKLIRNTLYDSLTGLPNRALLLDRLSQCLARSKRSSDTPFAVLLIDLDRFKVINEGLGHQVGDEVLIQAAGRLAHCVRPEDTVSRMGGDEFVVLLEKMANVLEVMRVADRIKKAFNKAFDVKAREIFTGASIGVAFGSARYQQPEEVLRDAETAMYRAKSQGRSHCQTFNTGMHVQAISLLERETELRRAVDQNEFCVFYQPIVDMLSGKAVGLEALLRWKHPERGLIPAVDFIALAEEMGLIHSIGQFVLKETCRQMQEWKKELSGNFKMTVSVNFSAKQFSNQELVRHVLSVLNEHDINPASLIVEITETALMETGPVVERMLRDFHALNTKLHIDDFGTGYSSLSYLGKFPIDAVKIDRSFVKAMQENVEIVRAIITLARKLRLQTIAEGVETREQAQQLRSLGCELGQGFYYSEPLEPSAVPGIHKIEYQS